MSQRNTAVFLGLSSTSSSSTPSTLLFSHLRAPSTPSTATPPIDSITSIDGIDDDPPIPNFRSLGIDYHNDDSLISPRLTSRSSSSASLAASPMFSPVDPETDVEATLEMTKPPPSMGVVSTYEGVVISSAGEETPLLGRRRDQDESVETTFGMEMCWKVFGCGCFGGMAKADGR